MTTIPRIAQLGSSDTFNARAARVEQALGRATTRLHGPVGTHLAAAWAGNDLLVVHLALGATTRLIAPLLTDKKTDPGVVVVDEAGRFVVPLVGGHGGGANALAVHLAEGLGATAVVTTATDALGVPALDTLGWPWAGDVAGVTRSILDGRPVRLERTQPWPLPSFGPTVSADVADPVGRILVTDTVPPAGDLPTVVVWPGSLVVGMGCNRGTSAGHLRDLLTATLDEAGLAVASVAAITSADVKADEQGLIDLAASLGVPFVTYPVETLAAQNVPNPSEVVASHVGSPSVSEASVLARGARLIVPKHSTSEATCAVGRIPARGRLSVVGLGPGSRDLVTPRARTAIAQASVVVGYGPYVEQIRDLIRPGTEVITTGMGGEEQRTSAAIARAREGAAVAMVCSGDPAIYAMASPVLEQGTDGIDVTIVPGITASLASSALLGAPLGHDHATISLSDLHTSWADIERRLQAAAEGDLVTVLYNPRSRTRLEHLPRALAILAAHRPSTTPVAMVREADRPEQEVVMSTIDAFDPAWVDMNALVIVGSSTTRYLSTGDGDQVMVTPRDYTWMPR